MCSGEDKNTLQYWRQLHVSHCHSHRYKQILGSTVCLADDRRTWIVNSRLGSALQDKVALAGWLKFSALPMADCHTPPTGAPDAWQKSFSNSRTWLRSSRSIRSDVRSSPPIHVRTDVEFQCLRNDIGDVEIGTVNVVMQGRGKGMAGVGYLR